VGEAFGGAKLSFQDLSTAKDLSFGFTNKNSQLLGGVQLEQLWRLGGTYVGLESDADFGSSTSLKYATTLRGVLGVPAGPFMVYGTGGVAMTVTHQEFTVTSAAETDGFLGDTRKYGWVAGGGVQVLLSHHLSLGVEGLYYGMGSETTAMTTVLAPEPFSSTIDRNFALVRARLDYRFTSIF
jgi:opacity protein-like surface antigen